MKLPEPLRTDIRNMLVDEITSSEQFWAEVDKVVEEEFSKSVVNYNFATDPPTIEISVGNPENADAWLSAKVDYRRMRGYDDVFGPHMSKEELSAEISGMDAFIKELRLLKVALEVRRDSMPA